MGAGGGGRFRIGVPLRPHARNHLIRKAVGQKLQVSGSVHIRQWRGQQGSSLRGKVIDSATRKPMEGATVGYSTSSTTTGADGTYTLTSVPEGTVVAHVRAPGTLSRIAVATVIGGA